MREQAGCGVVDQPNVKILYAVVVRNRVAKLQGT
jgi:hypothetical protein